MLHIWTLVFPTAFFVQQERERHDIQESRSGAQEKDKADSRSEKDNILQWAQKAKGEGKGRSPEGGLRKEK